jgi:hypothetical protein
MAISKEEAQTLLRKVVEEWTAAKGTPLLGSQLKVRLLEREPTFNERALQYKTFAAFVRDCPGLILETRGNTDFAVVPAGHPEALEDHGGSRTIRPHFWRAFVSFPKADEVRAFSPTTGLVYIGPAASRPEDATIPIDPIPVDKQLTWRKQFIESLEEPGDLKNIQLSTQGGFKAFTLALEDKPALRKRWHGFLLQKVSSAIRTWAEPLKLNESAWIAATPAQLSADPLRQKIYKLLDEVNTEDLLNLEIPIRMLLNVPPKGGKS